jgi:hypothetical protein
MNRAGPRRLTIEFRSREQQHSEYDWADISLGADRVGKARCRLTVTRLTICSINIYPEWEQRGFGREFVEWCQEHFAVVVADRVRYSAIGFWTALGFRDNHDGNWVYGDGPAGSDEANQPAPRP